MATDDEVTGASPEGATPMRRGPVVEQVGRPQAPGSNRSPTDGPPAPGWSRGGDGNWYPPDSRPRPGSPGRSPERPRREVEYSQFHVAAIVAVVFKVAAVLSLLVGLYLFFWIRSHYPSNSWREQAAVAGGAIFLAAALAFFAYVLDLLRALVFDSRRK